jgi:hypothetical protein
METDQSTAAWAVFLVVVVVCAVLRTLVALGKWRGARPFFKNGSRSSNNFIAVVTWCLVAFGVFGLLLSR